jgi:hypothetical protein
VEVVKKLQFSQSLIHVFDSTPGAVAGRSSLASGPGELSVIAQHTRARLSVLSTHFHDECDSVPASHTR